MSNTEALRAALSALLDRYTGLVNCGDCGNWNPEEEAPVIAARAALAQPAETDAELQHRTGEPHIDGWPLYSGLPPAASGEPLSGKWEGAEEWMPLAWELCADECGEEACTELVWEGGPVPEPWGDRWLKYEDEAKRLIALVRKHAPAAQPAPALVPPIPDNVRAALCQMLDHYGNDPRATLVAFWLHSLSAAPSAPQSHPQR